ncbi:hypothetical protein LLEC1_04204 [Akanthomyces lecanii]|uniref:Uncharacterized protein n=1 Tax=Cordyceps confragosa TaxID=2714763 RepID=A0A179IGQ5_CORDF|nr:hypothetical protein LLEC1_04204 [Akanthomyces lecanii]
MDAEPWGHEGVDVAELGLSLIRPFDMSKIEQPPTTIQELQSCLSISTYSIKIRGREQGKRERFPAENSKLVKAEDLEKALMEILVSFQGVLGTPGNGKRPPTDATPTPPLILVGFDLAFELRSLAKSFSKIAECFASWVDLQELVKDAAQLGSTSPSLRDSLTALGFGSIRTDTGSIWKKHSAAKDTLRIAAVLLGLSLRDADQGVLPLTFTWRRKWSTAKARQQYRGTGKLFKGLPKPREQFPFTARVDLLDDNDGAPHRKVTAKDLMEIFAAHAPAAAGSLKRGVSGFISLSSFDSLNEFVAAVNGMTCEEYGGSWAAVSFFDPALTPARTADELEEFNKARQQATILEKRKLRKQKKQGQGQGQRRENIPQDESASNPSL